MNRIATFEKVNKINFVTSLLLDFPNFTEEEATKIYEDIALPKRATEFSAGYDFFAPFDFKLAPGEIIKIPTAVRAKINEDYALFMFPRSSLGFKYRLQLNNTIGVIDADYYYADNEGHIFVKLTNDSKEDKILQMKKGEAFCQGIFLNYGITTDDNVTAKRSGGLGSTNSNK